MKQNADRLRDLSTITAGISEDFPVLERIARALEIMAGTALPIAPDWTAPAYTWDARQKTLIAASYFQPLSLELLLGIEQQAETLQRNTRQFASGQAANNALLWGARGTGKSSLVKAVFQKLQDSFPTLHLVEIHKEDLNDLIPLTDLLASQPDHRFIVFLDDLSFENSDDRYKSLKSALEGGVTGQAGNILIYATSNRRHLLPRTAEENANLHLHPAETAEENISLSDRFGLWLGFYAYDQATYLQMIQKYAKAYNIPISDDELRKSALEWSITRGARSGRVAWQFIRDLAGQHNRQLTK